MGKQKKLIIITGPTAVGKTAVSIHLAKKLNTSIVSADSRQFYKELKIGTAAPSSEELEEVNHFLVGNLSIHDYYNVSMFERDANNAIEKIFQTSDYAVLTGGSGLYIDTICYGIDDLPDPDPKLRKLLLAMYQNGGGEFLLEQLQKLDPSYYEMVDKKNPSRILRALEVCLQTRQSYSSLRKRKEKHLDFDVIKFCLVLPREELYQRINLRTDAMMEAGWLKEAVSLFSFRYLNALNTVGYKELFCHLEGNYTLEKAVEKIKTNTRRYAKRQLTWFKRDNSYRFISPNELEDTFESLDLQNHFH